MWPAAAVLLVALAGCTLVAPGTPVSTQTATTPAPHAIDPSAVVAALGPAPRWSPPTPERTDDIIARGIDFYWGFAASRYPDAARPEVAEIARAEGTSPEQAACLAAAPSGPRESAIASYVCHAQYPVVPAGLITEAQAGYLYDYWTDFVFPCFAENGFSMPTSPPARDAFVAEWPYQDWWPAPEPREPVSDDDRAAFEQRCPTTLDFSK